MAKETLRLPDSELKALQALWDLGPSTAREVREHLDKQRSETLAHATVVTLLQRLEAKKYIQKTGKQVGKAFVYRAVLQPQKAQAHLFKKYLSRFVGDDPIPVFSQLIESSNLTLDDIAQIKKLLTAQEKKTKENPQDESI